MNKQSGSRELTPRVFNQPIFVSIILNTKTNNQYSMVQIFSSVAAVWFKVDALRVELERTVTGVDGDAHGSKVSDGISQSVLIASFGEETTAFGGAYIPLIETTFTVISFVRI